MADQSNNEHLELEESGTVFYSDGATAGTAVYRDGSVRYIFYPAPDQPPQVGDLKESEVLDHLARTAHEAELLGGDILLAELFPHAWSEAEVEAMRERLDDCKSTLRLYRGTVAALARLKEEK